MKTKHTIGWLLLCAAMATSCNKEDAVSPEADKVAVSLNAGITAETKTTHNGDNWVAGDEVGIFMLTVHGNLPGDIVTGANNRKYSVSTAATGALTLAEGTPVYYPQSGNVDFIAYYPYDVVGTGIGEVTAGYQYNILVTDQSNPAAIDVLYAKAVNISKSKTAVNLQFSHVLSKITLNVKTGAGLAVTDIAGVATTDVSFTGMPTGAGLALQDGTLPAITAPGMFNPLKANTPTTGFDATFSAILIPQAATNPGRSVEFTISGNSYTWTIPGSETFEAGKHYVYPVTVNRSGITVGAPAIADWTTNDNGTGTAVVMPEMVRIAAGTFLMGSSDGSNPTGTPGIDPNATPAEPNREIDETQHRVTLTQDFYISKFQVTNTQYAAFLNTADIGSDGRGTVDGFGSQPLILEHSWGVTYTNGAWKAQSGYENHPIIYVTWYGAKAYADWIGGSLPTEAQWEYACRAGTTTAYSFGDNATVLGDYAWYFTNSGNNTHSVGTKPPTPWGLYDMHGNVYEWCADWYGDYSSSDVTDPTGPGSGDSRVRRGGSWSSSVKFCRSASRTYRIPNEVDGNFGFRVVFNK